MRNHTDGRSICSGMNRPRLLNSAGCRYGALFVVVTGVLFAAGRVGRSQQTTELHDSKGGDGAVATLAQAQDAAGSMRATVRQADRFEQRLLVPVGSDTVIDLNNPLVRASVSQPQIAEVKIVVPTQVIITGKGTGSTLVILTDEAGGQLEMNVVVEPPQVAELRALIHEVAPAARVDVRLVRDSVVLAGDVPDVDTSERIVEIASIYAEPEKIKNQMKVVGAQQVLLRCTVAEVSKSAVRRLGINGWMAGNNFRDVFVVNQLDGINPVNIGATAETAIQTTTVIDKVMGIPFATDRDEGLPLRTSSNFSLGFPRMQMQLFFDALRSNSLLRVLAEPNLVALNGQTAQFHAGGEFPAVTSGITGTTIDWRDFGITLRFTPTVIGRQMIRLNVAPAVSDLDPTLGIQTADVQVPFGLRSRATETTIELASGSTIAIAGLLDDKIRGVVNRIPGLGDVPVLGQLFRSSSYQRDLTELVILVTPELVSSLQPDQVGQVPGEEITEPNDWQLFGLGMLEGEPLVRNDADANEQALDTDVPTKYRKFSSPPQQMTLHGPWGPADPWETLQ